MPICGDAIPCNSICSLLCFSLSKSRQWSANVYAACIYLLFFHEYGRLAKTRLIFNYPGWRSKWIKRKREGENAKRDKTEEEAVGVKKKRGETSSSEGKRTPYAGRHNLPKIYELRFLIRPYRLCRQIPPSVCLKFYSRSWEGFFPTSCVMRFRRDRAPKTSIIHGLSFTSSLASFFSHGNKEKTMESTRKLEQSSIEIAEIVASLARRSSNFPTTIFGIQVTVGEVDFSRNFPEKIPG